MDEFDIVDNLILNGGLEFAGKDSETGEPLYRTTERLKDLDSQLSEELSAYFFDTTLKLWEKGFIDMDVTDRDPMIKLGPMAFDINAIKSLEKNERVVIEEIIKVLYNKNDILDI
jgi:hypothetical protein